MFDTTYRDGKVSRCWKRQIANSGIHLVEAAGVDVTCGAIKKFHRVPLCLDLLNCVQTRIDPSRDVI